MHKRKQMFGKVQLLKVTWWCERYVAGVVVIAAAGGAASADVVIVSFY